MQLSTWSLSVATVLLGVSLQVHAGNGAVDEDSRWWLEGGVGGGQINTRAQGMQGRHGAAILSVGAGFRATARTSIGLEYSTNAPVSACQRRDCEDRGREFRPAFNRATVFGEMRFFDGRLRMRYGAGDLSYCHAGGAGLNLWYLVFEDDESSRMFNCRAVHGFAKTLSVGYHWRMSGGDSDPVTGGLKLGVEDAYMRGKRSASLPPFHYRAVTLTLQFSFN
jgi:hypothetical protein